MNNELIRNHFDAFARIEAFGVKYAGSFPVPGRASALFGAIGALVPEQERLGVGQLVGETDYHIGTSAKRRAAERVEQHLRELRNTAKAVALADKDMDYAGQFQLPRSKSFAALVLHAKVAIAAARASLPRLREFELPATFLDEMEASVTELEQAEDQQDAGFSARVGGTASLTATVEAGLDLRKQLMPLIRNKFRDEAGILAEWESASRVVRAQRDREDATPAN